MCAAISGKIKDVTHFRFKKLRDLQICDQQLFDKSFTGERFGEHLTVSNKYGILFVGTPNGVRAIITADIEKVNEDEKKSRILADEYNYLDVVVASNILSVSLSCDDNILAVCTFRNGFIFADMFNISSLSSNVLPLTSFFEVKLSSDPAVKLVDFRWNPETFNMFATCMSDRSVSVYEIYDSTLKIIGSNTSANASAICWSPKGKQLVIGKHNGTMTQHLPNMQIAKEISAPDIFKGEASVINISWLSSFQFAVVYDNKKTPSVVIVTSPKSGSPTFVNFEDICYSSVDEKPLYYYMTHLTEWGILVCSSSSAIDIGVLAGGQNGWEQWNMEDSARAELPLVGNDYTFPLGMAVNLTSQRRIPINDNETVSPKPILHILASKGILLSYYIFNDTPDAKDMIRAPENILEGKVKFSIKQSHQEEASSNILKANNSLPKLGNIFDNQQKPNLQNEPESQLKLNLFTTPVKPGEPDSQLRQSLFSASVQPNEIDSRSKQNLFSSSLQPNAFTTQAGTTNLSVGQQSSLISGKPSGPEGNLMNKTVFNKPATSEAQSILQKPDSSAKQTNLRMMTATSPAFMPNIKPQVPVDKQQQSSLPTKVSENEKRSRSHSAVAGQRAPGQTALMSALVEEVAKFNNEVLQVREKAAKSSTYVVGSEEERINLLEKTRSLEAFVNSAKKASNSLNVDIHTLSGSILDMFSAIEEGRLLNERSKDPVYLNLHRNRSLDNIRAKKMKEIRSLYYYLQNQTQEVSMLLDSKWEDIEAIEKKSVTSLLYRPSIELVCRTLTTNKRVINNLQQKIDRLAGLIDKHRSQLINVSDLNYKEDKIRSANSSTVKRDVSLLELSKISKRFGNVDLNNDSSKTSENNLIPPSHFKSLRNALEKRQVSKVTIVSADEDFSRFLSPTAKLRNRFQPLPEDIEESEVVAEVPKLLIKSEVPESVSKTSPELPKINNFNTAFNLNSNNISKPFSSHSSASTWNSVFGNATVGKNEKSTLELKRSAPTTSSAQEKSTINTEKPQSTASQVFSFGTNVKTPLTSANIFNFGSSLGVTSTPAKSVESNTLPKLVNAALISAPESNQQYYEDITPPDSPNIRALQSEEDFSRESVDEEEEDYEDDDEEYYDENEAYDYPLEEDLHYNDKEGSEGEPERLFANDEVALPSLEGHTTTTKPVISDAPNVNAAPQDLADESSSVSPTTKAAPGTFHFTPETSKANSTQPISFGGQSTVVPPTAATTSTTTAVTTSVSPATFSFKTSPTIVGASTTTHSFILPTYNAATTAATSPTSFFGKFVSTTPSTLTSSTTIFGTTQSPTKPASIFQENKSTAEDAKPTFDAKPAFEQNSASSTTSIFGTPGKSAFAGLQTTTPGFSVAANTSTEASAKPAVTPNAFGQPSLVFQTPAAVSSNITPFGQPSSPNTSGELIGQGNGTGFFSGLGSKPSAANANKNVFGGNSFGTTGNTSIFESKSPTAPEPRSPFSGAGSFTSGGSFSGGSGSVSQTGFGGFQQSSIKQGGFGGSPQFGSTPTFGGSPGATFGTIGNHVFGSRSNQNSSFSSFASSNELPTFGSLASQSANPPSFSSVLQQPAFGSSNTPTFGASNTPAFGASNTPAFGASNTPAFGASNTPAFGATNTPTFGASNTPTFGSVANTTPSPFNSPSTFGNAPKFNNQGGSNFSQWRS